MEIYTTIFRYKYNGKYFTEDELGKKGISPDDCEKTEIELEVEYYGGWVDEGIGPYEYWGMRGYDSRACYEVEEIASMTDEDGKDWLELVTDKEYDEIREKCCEDGERNDDGGGE